MGTRHSRAVGVIGALAIVGLFGWTASALAPAPAAATLACDDDPPGHRPTKESESPSGAESMATPIDGTLLNRRLPCAENVSLLGLSDDGLANPQRGFDFYSWLTFLALC
jgi:hypothetical protein